MLHLILLLLFSQTHAEANKKERLKVYWNFPSEKCITKHNVPIRTENFDIVENNDHKFIGEKVSVFYEFKHDFEWPYYKGYDPEKPIRGGLPQLALTNIDKHLAAVKKVIEQTFPDPNFDGPAVFDVEEWRPAFNLNWNARAGKPGKGVYQTESVKLALKLNPGLSAKAAKAAGISQFNAAAKEMILKTLQLAKELRPRAKWGYYAFPLCNYNAGKVGEYSCSQKFKTYNDELSWLYAEQTGLFPSPYLGEGRETSPEEAMRYIYAILEETKRIQASLPTNLPIYAYTKFEYDPYHSVDSFYSEQDLCNSFRQYYDFGIEGILIWSTDRIIKERCPYIADNLAKTTGPYIDAVRDRAEFCAESQCSGNGKCIRMTKPIKCDLEYDFSNYKCACDHGWSGERCDVIRSV